MFIDSGYNVLYIEYNQVFLPIGCLTSSGFSEGVELLDTTTRENGGWRTSVPTLQSYEIQFSGLAINSNWVLGDSSKISYDRLKILKRNRTLINWKIQDSNLVFVDSGQGYISSLSSSDNIDEFQSFEATIVGYGYPVSTSSATYEIADGAGNSIADGVGNALKSGPSA